MIERDDIHAAWDRIRPRVRTTPVLALESGAFGIDPDVHVTLKLELLQHTGSFKPRGAFNKMLASEVSPQGVVAASGGNFGLAVAYAAQQLGHRAEIFVPSTSPVAKIDRVRSYGAEVRVVDGYFDDAAVVANERQVETGALGMHPFDQPEVVAGQGTIGMELARQVPGADAVLVATGGGGLVGGIAAWYRGDVRVVAVEPVGSRCLDAALEAGEPVAVPVGGVAADSLGTRQAGTIAFEVARRFVSDVTLVEDDAIREAQRSLWRELRLVAEPGGATALASLSSGAFTPPVGSHVVVVVCGANCDPADVIG